MRILVVLALTWCCSGKVVVPYSSVVPYYYDNVVPYPLAFKFYATDAFGQTTFGHQSIDQTRNEVRLADGRVIGQYSYIDSNGEPAITYYEAGPNGYRVLGSNILPEAPTADLAPPVNDLVAPEPVGYTAEVAEARAEFMKIYNAAAAAASAAPDVPEVETPPAATFTAETTAEAEEDPTVEEPKVEASPTATFTADKTEVEEPASKEPQTEESAAAILSVDVKTSEEGPIAEEQVSRKKRDVEVPLPYLHAVPTEAKATVETKQFETVDAATPADTTKIELTTKEHVFKVPAIKYVRPVVKVNPVEYTPVSPVVSPAVVPYYGSYPYYPFAFSGLQYPTLLTLTPKEE